MSDTVESYAARHRFCITLDQALKALSRVNPEVNDSITAWRDNDGYWFYRYPNSQKVHRLYTICDHPEDPVCTINPTEETLYAAKGGVPPKQESQTKDVLEDTFATMLQKLDSV